MASDQAEMIGLNAGPPRQLHAFAGKESRLLQEWQQGELRIIVSEMTSNSFRRYCGSS
jgi:hypothetical protein